MQPGDEYSTGGYQVPEGEVYDPKAALNESQREALVAMEERVGTLDLSETEKQWSDTACLLRYLRARQYNVDKAFAMFKSTIDWRREYKPEALTVEDIRVEFINEGKMYPIGKDKYGRPTLCMRPRYDNTTEKKPKVASVVYLIERCIREMDATRGVEKSVWIIDHKDSPMLVGPSKIQLAIEIANILQNHYPERLYLAFHLNPSFLLSAFLKAVNPFLDEVTKRKTVQVSKDKQDALLEAFDQETLDQGGVWSPVPYDGEKLLATFASEDASR